MTKYNIPKAAEVGKQTGSRGKVSKSLLICSSYSFSFLAQSEILRFYNFEYLYRPLGVPRQRSNFGVTPERRKTNEANSIA